MLKKLLLAIAILLMPAATMAFGQFGDGHGNIKPKNHAGSVHHHHHHGIHGHTHYQGRGHYQHHFSPYISPFAYGYYPQVRVYSYGYYNPWRFYTHGYFYYNGRIYPR